MATPSDARPSLVEAESSSTLPRSPSGRLPAPSSRELRSRISSAGDRNNGDGALSSNGHLQMRNHRPSSTASHNRYRASSSSSSSSSTTTAQSTSFFVMITGHIESAISSTSSLNDHLYCRYSFSYGPDWEVVHGVSVGLSQMGRRGARLGNNGGGGGGGALDGYDEEGNTAIVWNFPIEISFQSTSPHGWPRLVVSVYGLDFMGRDVVRGYAHLLLPARPGGHTRYLRTYVPVSGSTFVRALNWLMGTSPEYYDSRMVARGEGRAVTRVVSGDRTVKVNLMVTIKDFPTFGYVSSPP
jgi:B9 domain-containing protein 1